MTYDTKPSKIKMYTSGCPKNKKDVDIKQITSPSRSKKDV